MNSRNLQIVFDAIACLADGVEYGSRGAALRRDGCTDGEAKLFPQGNMEVHKDPALH